MTPQGKERLLAKFNGKPPVNAVVFQRFQIAAGIRLPEDYAQFLQQADGGEGFIGNTYAIIWRIGELLQLNSAYQVGEYAPGLFLFGSDGGGEAFGFDTRTPIYANRFSAVCWHGLKDRSPGGSELCSVSGKTL